MGVSLRSWPGYPVRGQEDPRVCGLLPRPQPALLEEVRLSRRATSTAITRAASLAHEPPVRRRRPRSRTAAARPLTRAERGESVRRVGLALFTVAPHRRVRVRGPAGVREGAKRDRPGAGQDRPDDCGSGLDASAPGTQQGQHRDERAPRMCSSGPEAFERVPGRRLLKIVGSSVTAPIGRGRPWSGIRRLVDAARLCECATYVRPLPFP
jgi:hypothetical protein